MFFSHKEWLKGWRVVCDDQWDAEKLFWSYEEEIRSMTDAGREFFSCGAIQALAGTEAPEEYQKGTGGNFAIRKKGEKKFLVTARGAHKGNLERKDFVVVHGVDWRWQNIYITSLDNFAHLPSTDSPLIAIPFAVCADICVWAHFHEPVDTFHTIRFAYPALNDVDWDLLKYAVKRGIREMNMVDHDLYRKGERNNSADSAIILGEDSEETFFRARLLLKRAKKLPRA